MFFILIYIEEYAKKQIIKVSCKTCNKHIEKILALLRLLYKHYKQGILQKNRIKTKIQNFGGCHGNVPTVCLSSIGF